MQSNNVNVQFLQQHGFTGLQQVKDETLVNTLLEQFETEAQQKSIIVGDGVNEVNIVVYQNYIAAYFCEYAKNENNEECEDEVDLFCCNVFTK